MSKAGKGYRFANQEYDRSGYLTKGRLMGKLYAHFDDGEGDVVLDRSIDEESPLWRVDVIGDIINLLQDEYSKAYDEMIDDLVNLDNQRKEEEERERMG